MGLEGLNKKYSYREPKAKSWEIKKQKSRTRLEEEKNSVDKDGGAEGLKEQGRMGFLISTTQPPPKHRKKQECAFQENRVPGNKRYL